VRREFLDTSGKAQNEAAENEDLCDIPEEEKDQARAAVAVGI